jgi:hypothetical protein
MWPIPVLTMVILIAACERSRRSQLCESRARGLHQRRSVGLKSLSRYLAVALAKRRTTVDAVSPGATEDSVLNSAESGWVPMRRLATPADVGNLVALMCSEEAAFVTGQTVYVDGGALLGATGLPLELQAAI